MIKITVPEDCGNAPRKEVIRDFNIAFIKGDIDAILEYMADDIAWNMVGSKTIKGKEAAKKNFKPCLAVKELSFSLKQS